MFKQVWHCSRFVVGWALLRGLARTDDAKVKHLFGLCKGFGRKNVQGECKKASLLVFFCRAAAIFMQKMCKVSAKKQVYLFFLPSRSHFYSKNAEMEVVFNRCWVFRDAKCGICQTKLVIYIPYLKWTCPYDLLLFMFLLVGTLL